MTSTDAVSGTVSPAATNLSRDQILNATSRCFFECGYDGTTIRRIAKNLNCAVGSIYRYFTEKRDLLDAMAQRNLKGVLKVIDSGDSFDQSIRVYLQHATSSPQMYRLMFWLACLGPVKDTVSGTMERQGSPPKPINSSVGPPLSPTAQPLIIRQIIAGWSRRLGDEMLAQRCWAMVHGCLMLGLDREQTMQAVVDLLGHRTGIHTPIPRAQPLTRAAARPAGQALSSLLSDPSPPTPAHYSVQESTPEDICLL